MTDRALVIDDATGRIKRSISAPPEMLALQVEAGESLFLITNDNGLHLADGALVVSESGALVRAPSAPTSVTAPAYDLAYVAV